MATPFNRVQFTNIVAYHILLSLVNLLNLPLAKGTFVPRRSMSLTVLERDVERLRMLKKELDLESPEAVRGYLVGAKTLAFELAFLFHQDTSLPRNEAFFEDFERLSTLLSHAETVDDAAHMRELAYKLSVMLPYYEDAERMEARNAQADAWFAGKEAGAR